jgi:ribosomal protein S18 acetylase RimI-like enzyme
VDVTAGRDNRDGMPMSTPRVRPASLADAEALAEIRVRTWQAAYRGLVPQDHLDGLDPAAQVPGWRQWIRDARPPTAILVLDDGGVAGYVVVSAAPEPGTGQVNAIYLLPERWGRGCGRLLMDAGLDHLRAAGFRQAVLWTLDTNRRAQRFYEIGGWTADGASQVDESLGLTLNEIRYRRHLGGHE